MWADAPGQTEIALEAVTRPQLAGRVTRRAEVRAQLQGMLPETSSEKGL